MKGGAPVCAALLGLWFAPNARAAQKAQPGRMTFDAVVSGIERRFRIRPQPIPGMGFSGSMVTRVFTKVGVKGVQVAEFDHLTPALTPDALDATLRSQLGDSWRPFIEDLERDSGESTFAYARVDGGTLLLFIADLESGELDLVETRLSEQRMAAWVQDPEGSLAARQRVK